MTFKPMDNFLIVVDHLVYRQHQRQKPPGFAGVPLVEIDNHGFADLALNGSNSILAGLSIVNANGAGVAINGQHSSGITSAV
jgi:hypothetical protein